MARRARERYGKPVDDFDTIDLESLFRFHVYVRDAQFIPVPLSFRAFVQQVGGEDGDHRKMIDAVDGIEAKAKQLMIARAILDENRKKTGEYTDSFAEAANMRTKREPGAVTDYGRAWAALGGYLYDLIELIIEAGDHPPFLHKIIGEQHAELKQYVQILHAERKRKIGEN